MWFVTPVTYSLKKNPSKVKDTHCPVSASLV